MKQFLIGIIVVFNHWLASAVLAQPVQQAVVTLPAGSGLDREARLIMKRYTELFGVNHILTNRPGAEGAIGINHALTQMPSDTLIFARTGHVIGLGADTYPSRLDPLLETLRQPYVLFLRKNFPANNFDEFISYVKANPGQVSIGMVSKATTFPIVLEWERRNNVKFNHVFYGATGRPEMDAATGTLDAVFTAASVYFGTGIEERVKLIGVTDTASIPGVDSRLMLGNDARLGTWFIHGGIYVNSALDAKIKRRLHSQLLEIMQSTWARETFAGAGVRPTGSSPEDFAKVINQAWTVWQRVENK